MIKISKVKEGVHILDFCWYRPFFNALDLDWVHCNGVFSDDHPQVFHLREIKVTLFKFERERELLHALKNMESAESAYFRVIRKDENVIHVDDEPPLGDHVTERVIHEPLEGGRGAAKPKEHDSWFKESFVCDEGSLSLISIFDVDIVIFRSDVHLSEDRGSFKFVDKIRYQREGIGIFDGVLVQVAIVLTRAKGAIFLPYKEEQSCLRGFEGSDPSLRLSSINFSAASYSLGNRGYTLPPLE